MRNVFQESGRKCQFLYDYVTMGVTYCCRTVPAPISTTQMGNGGILNNNWNIMTGPGLQIAVGGRESRTCYKKLADPVSQLVGTVIIHQTSYTPCE